PGGVQPVRREPRPLGRHRRSALLPQLPGSPGGGRSGSADLAHRPAALRHLLSPRYGGVPDVSPSLRAAVANGYLRRSPARPDRPAARPARIRAAPPPAAHARPRSLADFPPARRLLRLPRPGAAAGDRVLISGAVG